METMIVESTTTAPHVVTLLWVIFVLFALDVFGRLLSLGRGVYPRLKKRWEDAFETMLNLSVAIWVAVVLWGNP